MANSVYSTISLPSWPVCTNNLSWSEDHLAVAVADGIHILTPKIDPDTHSTAVGQWHQPDTIPANLFSYTEHRVVGPATIADERVDKSDCFSPIRRLSWSSLGIGLYKRQVLAVLTKNWLLSIWESDGTAASWHRTCLVNDFVKTDSTADQQQHIKIRAFSWLQPAPLPETRKRLFQDVVVIDDNAKVSLLRLQKSERNRYGSWECSLLHAHKISDPELPVNAGRRVRQQPRISDIEVGKWQKLTDEDGSIRMLLIEIEMQRCLDQTMKTRLVFACEPLEDGELFIHSREQQLCDQQSSNSSVSRRMGPVLSQLEEDFIASLKFPGPVRHQIWGSAASHNGSGVAACVTSQNSEMDQCMASSQGDCTMVYAWQRTGIGRVQSCQEPVFKILRWITAHAHAGIILNELDVDIVRAAAGCISTAFTSSPELIAWADEAEELVAGFVRNADLDVNGDADMDQEPVAESCKVCPSARRSAISFSEDLLSGRCAEGHTFARCGISFVAIQEPAASKYCAQCGKEFLIPELGPQNGPSLRAALFEEFDVCPYCRGKFRGRRNFETCTTLN
jgi:hypothetical protein